MEGGALVEEGGKVIYICGANTTSRNPTKTRIGISKSHRRKYYALGIETPDGLPGGVASGTERWVAYKLYYARAQISFEKISKSKISRR